jgi:DNA-binding winged helix-turn-helix (wHTH) protein
MSYRFDDVEIDTEGFRVTKAGEAVRLEPKALELLLFLAERPGRLVTKAEIQEAVWKDAFVTENALTRLVAQIRRGLGDDAREARYIETVPTRGYRFVATFAPIASPEARPARWRPGLQAAAVAAAVLAVAFVALALRAASARRGSASAISGARPAPRAVETQISTGALLNVFPRFSPDGSSIVFSSLLKGSMEIVVRGLALGAREVAVTSDGMQNVQPAFSPDGRLLAYHSVARGGIWLVPALGGVPRPLTSFGSYPAWSPDGSRIAFQSQSWVGSGESLQAASEGSTIWLVTISGGEPRRLTSVAEVGPGGQGALAWSPDGRLVSFLAGTRVFTMRARRQRPARTSGRLGLTASPGREGAGERRCGRGRGGNWCVWRSRS